MNALLLLLAVQQPATAAGDDFWQPTQLPVHLTLAAPTVRALPHGPDTSSGEEVPPGGFSYKKKRKQPVFSYIGAGVGVFGLLYLGGSRTASFEAADATTAAEREAKLDEQATKRTVGFTLLGTAGACFVVDIFI